MLWRHRRDEVVDEWNIFHAGQALREPDFQEIVLQPPRCAKIQQHGTLREAIILLALEQAIEIPKQGHPFRRLDISARRRELAEHLEQRRWNLDPEIRPLGEADQGEIN